MYKKVQDREITEGIRIVRIKEKQKRRKSREKLTRLQPVRKNYTSQDTYKRRKIERHSLKERNERNEQENKRKYPGIPFSVGGH